jgi:hypothetical protein
MAAAQKASSYWLNSSIHARSRAFPSYFYCCNRYETCRSLWRRLLSAPAPLLQRGSPEHPGFFPCYNR